MAMKTGTGIKHKADRRTRGRTTVSTTIRGESVQRPTKPNVPEVLRAETTRPQSAGVKHRGDRRDTSKAYTGNTRHPSRGNTPRIDTKTRAR